MNFKQAFITFWFKELDYNPICKVGELEERLQGQFKVPFLINDCEPFINIALPRIVANSLNNSCFFNMTLVNANLNILFKEEDKEQVMLIINEKMQLFFDILMEVFDLKIIYSSIKIEYSEKIDNVLDYAKEVLIENDSLLEDLMVKTSVRRDEKYYINYIVNTTKEVNVNIKLPSKIKPLESDMMARSMLVSLQDGEIIGDIKNHVLEINNRLLYNNDHNYLVNKDSIRDLLYEFKNLLISKTKD